jgi:L-ascorbate metabolism protein UlaG (beta-lactamase superfamily)
MPFTFTWFGHGTLGFQIGTYRIVVDPFFNNNPASLKWVSEIEADFILASHGHFDHIEDLEELARKTKALVLSNDEIARWCEAKGLNVHGQHIGGSHQHAFGTLKLTPAMHGSDLPDGTDGGNPAGFLITSPDGQKIYTACDTGLFGDMKLIGDEGLDLAVLPIGDNYTMGPDDALKAVKLLNPKHVVPVHYNTWDLIKQDADSWAEHVREETMSQVHVMKPGQRITF